MKYLEPYATILILLLLGSAGQLLTACDFPQEEPKDGYKFSGLYENGAYEYSAKIPLSYVGYDAATGGGSNHRGFSLTLGEAPRSYILVWAEPNNSYASSPFDDAVDSLSLMHGGEEREHLSGLTVTQSHLGRLSALRLLVKYTCSGSNDHYVRVSTVAVSPDKRLVYEITLWSRAERFEPDVAVLDEILKSWKYIGH
jgi:hypothetical protein